MTKQIIKAVMFDLDGTIVDTEWIHQLFWAKTFKHFGYKMDKKHCLQLRSLGRPYVINHFHNVFGPQADYWEIKNYRAIGMDKFINENGIKTKKGIPELLKWLKENNILVALTTANTEEKAKEYLSKVNLIQYFDKIITCDDIKKGKPAPDTYLYACKQLGLKPNDTIAVEDSPNGVLSAYLAGTNTVMIPDLTKPTNAFKKLNITVLDDGFKLIEHIKNILKI